jgi:hypothetical protein
VKRISRDQVRRVIDDTGRDIRIYERYSGRAMYGEQCFGVVCAIGDFALFCAALGSSADDWDFVGGCRTDDLGLSTIFYFPGVQLDGDPGADDG